VLGVASQVRSIVVEAQPRELTESMSPGATAATLPEAPPSDPAAAEEWARQWATTRARLKAARDYVAADRIRALLGQHGFQVRDSRDGSIEVVRIAVPKG
jgi:cysteinyl-tRNA synthetase